MNAKKIITLLLALVLTWLVTREMLPVGQAPKAVWAALALAAFLVLLKRRADNV